MMVLRILNINAEGLFNDKPAPPPPDPRFEAIKAKATNRNVYYIHGGVDVEERIILQVLLLMFMSPENMPI